MNRPQDPAMVDAWITKLGTLPRLSPVRDAPRRALHAAAIADRAVGLARLSRRLASLVAD